MALCTVSMNRRHPMIMRILAAQQGFGRAIILQRGLSRQENNVKKIKIIVEFEGDEADGQELFDLLYEIKDRLTADNQSDDEEEA